MPQRHQQLGGMPGPRRTPGRGTLWARRPDVRPIPTNAWCITPTPAVKADSIGESQHLDPMKEVSAGECCDTPLGRGFEDPPYGGQVWSAAPARRFTSAA